MSNEKQTLVDWQLAQNFTVIGTLKFNNGFDINDTLAEKLVCKYFCALDRVYYGNAATNKNVRHNRAVFLHRGESQQNTHYHFLAKPNTDPMLFCRLARKQWAKLDTRTIGYLDTEIEAIRDNEKAANYMLHEYHLLGAETLCTSATFLNAAPEPLVQYRNIHQLRRLLKLDSNEYDKIEKKVATPFLDK